MGDGTEAVFARLQVAQAVKTGQRRCRWPWGNALKPILCAALGEGSRHHDLQAHVAVVGIVMVLTNSLVVLFGPRCPHRPIGSTSIGIYQRDLMALNAMRFQTQAGSRQPTLISSLFHLRVPDGETICQQVHHRGSSARSCQL